MLALCLWAWTLPARAQSAAPQSLVAHVSYRWGDSPVDENGVPAWTHEAEGWTSLDALTTPPGRGENTFLWLQIDLPASAWRDPALLLGRVVGAFEIYAGGKRLFGAGEIGGGGRVVAPGSSWHLAPLAPEHLGQRLHVRVASLDSTGIGLQRFLFAGERADLLVHLAREGLGSFALGALSLVVALVALLGSLWRRRGYQLLAAFGGYALVAGLLMWSLSELVPVALPAPLLWQRAMVVSCAWAIPALGFFLSTAMLTAERRWFTWLNSVMAALGALLTLFALVDPAFGQRVLMLTLPLLLCGVVACVVLTLIEARAGNVDARLFVAGLAVLLVTSTIDSLGSIASLATSGMTFHWGLFAVTMAFALIVARQFSQVHDTVTLHSHKLEQRKVEVERISTRLTLSAGELVDVVERLRTLSGEQNAGLTRQASTLQETRITAEELKQIALVTAQKAQSMLEAAQHADDIGQSGAQALTQSLGGLESIRVEVAELGRRIAELDGRTRAIAGIVDTVKGLADQSNMLALNAAIEAVRSGEHGKGFAVVAREIRSLADQSIQSTGRIREILAGITQDIRGTAELSSRGQDRVRASLQQVQQSGERLKALSGIVRESSQSVRQISAAVHQQSAGIGQLFAAIDDLSRQMNDTMEQVRATESATQSVQSVAESMLQPGERAVIDTTQQAA